MAVRLRAGLDNVRIHDLRHSYASRALALGENLPMIGKLLGHAQIETTARYSHLSREAAERIAVSIAADILSKRLEILPNHNPCRIYVSLTTASGRSRARICTVSMNTRSSS